MLIVSYLLFYLSRDSVFVNKRLSQHSRNFCATRSADCQSDNVAYSPGPRDSVFVNKALSQHSRPLCPSSADCQNDGIGVSVFTARKRSLRRLCFNKRLPFCPQGRSAPRGSPPGGWGVGQTSPPQSDTMGYGQRACGTHPSLMHSCC